jgi:hypothetical protein
MTAALRAAGAAGYAGKEHLSASGYQSLAFLLAVETKENDSCSLNTRRGSG